MKLTVKMRELADLLDSECPEGTEWRAFWLKFTCCPGDAELYMKLRTLFSDTGSVLDDLKKWKEMK